MKKITFLSLILILPLSIALTGCDKNNKKDSNTKIDANTSENIVMEQVVEGLKISNVSLVYEDGSSKYEAIVTNTTQQDIDALQIVIHLKDKNDNEIVALYGNILDGIKVGESKSVVAYYQDDLNKSVTNVSYEIVR